MMKVKVVYGDDMRRWRYPQMNRYAALTQFIRDTFKFSNTFYIQFADDEDDLVTITSEADFDDAFLCAQEEQRKSLKIFVKEGSIDRAHSNENAGDNEPKSEVFNESVQTGASNDKPCQPNGPTKNCSYWRESGLNFLENKEIQQLLPELVHRVVVALRAESKKGSVNEEKRQDGNEMNDDNEEVKVFSTILMEILNEDKFKAIASHELVVEKLPCILPFISTKITMYLPMLLQFNEDAIAAWVPHLIQIGIRALKNFQNITFDIDIDPNNWQGQIPQWFAYTNTCGQPKEEDKCHRGVACDECNMYPIKGDRYKCGVCPNYDLCSKCEASGCHDKSHPLVKFSVPVSESSHLRFGGLREVMQSHRQHGGAFGGPFHGQRGGRGRWHHGPRGRGHGPHHHGPFGRHFGRGGRHCPYMARMNSNNNNYNNNNNRGCPYFSGREQGNNRNESNGMNENINLLNQCTEAFGNSLYSKNNVKEAKKEAKRAKREAKLACKELKKALKKEKKEFKKSYKKGGYCSRRNKQDDGIMCVCGELLNKTVAFKAYKPCVTVTCDVCNSRVDSHSLVYHCPSDRTIMHPNGYDVCGKCVALQMSSFASYEKEEDNNGISGIEVNSNINNNQMHDKDIVMDDSDDDINNQNKERNEIEVSVSPKMEPVVPSAPVMKENNNNEDGDNMDIEMNVFDLYDDVSPPANNVNEVSQNAQASQLTPEPRQLHNNDDASSVLDEIFSGNVNGNGDDNEEIIIMDDENDENVNENVNESGSPSAVVVNENEVEAEVEAEFDDEPVAEPIAQQVVPEIESEPEEELFAYQDSLDAVVAMGFEDNDGVRALLIQHKGNLDRTINQLLG